MKRSGSIFPERIDSFSQLPLLQENSIQAIASNSLRSAILRIEETIGERVLDSKIYNKFLSLKDRFDFIDIAINAIESIQLPNNIYYRNYTVLQLSDTGWVKKDSKKEIKQLGIVMNNSIIINGLFWIENDLDLEVGKRIDILDEKLVQSNDLLYIGTIVAKNNNLAQVLIRNTWTM